MNYYPGMRNDFSILKGRTQQGRRFRILLVDDNFDMREYLGRLLSEKYDVISVCDGTNDAQDLFLPILE